MKYQITTKHGTNLGVCRHGACMKPGTGYPPLCREHTPNPANATTIPWPVPMARLMGRRA